MPRSVLKQKHKNLELKGYIEKDPTISDNSDRLQDSPSKFLPNSFYKKVEFDMRSKVTTIGVYLMFSIN